MHGRGDTGNLAPPRQQTVATRCVAGQTEPDVTGGRAVRVTGVLQGAVFEQQLGTDRADPSVQASTIFTSQSA